MIRPDLPCPGCGAPIRTTVEDVRELVENLRVHAARFGGPRFWPECRQCREPLAVEDGRLVSATWNTERDLPQAVVFFESTRRFDGPSLWDQWRKKAGPPLRMKFRPVFAWPTRNLAEVLKPKGLGDCRPALAGPGW